MKCNAYNVFFKNLSNQLKIDIVSSLKKSPKSVKEIYNELNSEQSKVSHALASLRRCSIITVKQNGKQRIYSLNKKTIVPILKIIDKHRSNFCEECKKNGNLS